MSLAHDIRDYLSTSGLGTVATDLFAGNMPPNPDLAIAVYEGPGRGTAHAMNGSPGRAKVAYASVQVVCRGEADTYDVPRALAQRAFLLLDGMGERTLNGVRYLWARSEQGEPYKIGVDELNRPLIACNYSVIKELSTTS